MSSSYDSSQSPLPRRSTSCTFCTHCQPWHHCTARLLCPGIPGFLYSSFKPSVFSGQDVHIVVLKGRIFSLTFKCTAQSWLEELAQLSQCTNRCSPGCTELHYSVNFWVFLFLEWTRFWLSHRFKVNQDMMFPEDPPEFLRCAQSQPNGLGLCSNGWSIDLCVGFLYTSSLRLLSTSMCTAQFKRGRLSPVTASHVNLKLLFRAGIDNLWHPCHR